MHARLFDFVLLAAWVLHSGLHEIGIVSVGMPAGWLLRGHRIQEYDVGIDRQVAHSGKRSVYLRYVANSMMPLSDRPCAGIMQAIKSGDFRGKRIRISAFLKTHEVQLYATLWARIDGDTSILSGDPGVQNVVTGSTSWLEREVVLDVPASARGIAFGAQLTGRGTLWVDDVKIERVGDSVRTTRMPSKLFSGRRHFDSEIYSSSPQNLHFEE